MKANENIFFFPQHKENEFFKQKKKMKREREKERESSFGEEIMNRVRVVGE